MLNKLFKLDEKNTNAKTEVIAGLTTFLAMAYILGVNPAMLADGGMPATGVFFATAVASEASILDPIPAISVGISAGLKESVLPVLARIASAIEAMVSCCIRYCINAR